MAGLPKARSGNIVRRILRKIAANEHDVLGGTTARADPEVVAKRTEGRRNRPDRDADKWLG